MTKFKVHDERTPQQKEDSLELYITDTGFSLLNDYGKPIISAEKISETGIFQIDAFDTQTEGIHHKRFKVRL